MYLLDIIGPMVLVVTLRLHRLLRRIRKQRILIGNLYILNGQLGFVRRRNSSKYKEIFRRLLTTVDQKLEGREFEFYPFAEQTFLSPTIGISEPNPTLCVHQIDRVTS